MYLSGGQTYYVGTEQHAAAWLVPDPDEQP